MNGFQNRKGPHLQKPFPGCMGRMINIFDLSIGMPRTKLLTDKPHQDVSPIRTNRPDAVNKKSLDNFGVQEDKTITGRKHLSKKSGGTQMKMLIAQEMSRVPQSEQKPSNVVAKLMGLDTLTVQQSALTVKRSSQEGYSHKSLSGEFQGHWQQEDSSYHKTLQSDTKSCARDNDFKDVHEVWKQPSRSTHFKDKPPQNRKHDENPIEERKTLVHQKFTEAKRLATDEKLLQSKEFQEALEVLSSNRDLFLKFLEEPNALFSKHLPESQNISPASQTRRITVLKPSKTMEPKGEAQKRKLLHPAVEDVERDINVNWRSSRSPNFVHHKAESISQPTRIVVLKPNPGMSHEMKAGVASAATSKRLEGRECCGSLEPDEATEPKEIAKEITRQMQKHMRSNQKNEIAISSTLSNGYVGDESSFTRSENNYIKEECDNTSYSESVISTSRHVWDCSFRLGSPFSISSFSRADHSPEPSVIKEAKKRLSERLAMVSSNGINQEQSQLRRSSSTLGDMLAIAKVKKEEGADNLTISSRSFCGEQEQKALASCLSIGGMKEECSEDFHRNLARSKSVSVSSSVYEHSGLREEVPDSMICKSIVPKEVIAKSKSGMSSFTGKVSSLFLSRIKKAGRERPHIPSCFLGSNHSETCGTNRNDASLESFRRCHSEEIILVNSEGKTGKASSSSTLLKGQKQGTSISKGSPSEKSRASENPRENQDQPSPISVLEAPFDDNANSSICLPSASIISGHPQALSRSPPIGSISRTLTWENPREIPHQSTLKLSRFLSRECEEQERFLLVQKLLSCANLLDNAECGTVLGRWHSLDSPLDPILLDEFLDRKEEEAKCRERRSNQRLLFDCVNAALLSIGQATLASSYPWATAYGWQSKERRTCAPVAEEVSRLVKDWFSSERHISSEAENRNLVVDKLVKGEIAGRGWTESMCMEVAEFSREISGKVLEELVEEALTDLTDGCL